MHSTTRLADRRLHPFRQGHNLGRVRYLAKAYARDQQKQQSRKQQVAQWPYSSHFDFAQYPVTGISPLGVWAAR